MLPEMDAISALNSVNRLIISNITIIESETLD